MEQTKKWGFWLLTAFVVGNMVGSGIFSLPSTLAKIASPFGATSAWLLTGARCVNDRAGLRPLIHPQA